jgi:hypothetical protein
MSITNGWQQCDRKVFWGDIASGEHVVQIYDDDTMLLNTLADYAQDGFYAGDSVIVIATGEHLEALNSRFRANGLNLGPLIAADQYIPLNADETLSKFMVNGSPDEKYFMETVSAVIKRARKNGRKIRAFGEMVALLWERENGSATIQLEQLWNKFCAVETISLFCAYPKSGFTRDAGATVMHICGAHSRQVGISEMYPSDIQYKNVV